MRDTIYILCEGYTENYFIHDVLNPGLGIHTQLRPIIVKTKLTKQGDVFRGGSSKYHSIKKQILDLCSNSNTIKVTTMLDYYNLNNDFPGKDTIPEGTCFNKVQHLEREFLKDINNDKFFPYFSLHEFESLVLADTEIFFNIVGRKNNVSDFTHSISQYSSTEEINDGIETHPSKRIIKYANDYRKISQGIRILKNIGLSKLEEKCPHFKDWLDQLRRYSVQQTN